MKAVGKILSRHLRDNSALIVTLFESLTLKGSDIYYYYYYYYSFRTVADFSTFFHIQQNRKGCFSVKALTAKYLLSWNLPLAKMEEFLCVCFKTIFPLPIPFFFPEQEISIYSQIETLEVASLIREWELCL